MADSFPFKLVTPTGIMADSSAEMVTAISPLGEFGVLAGHVNFITSLIPCILTVKDSDGQVKLFLISSGLCEVKDGAMVALVTEAAEAPKLDASAVMEEVVAAERRLGEVSFYEPEYEEAERALQLARARLRAAELPTAH